MRGLRREHAGDDLQRAFSFNSPHAAPVPRARGLGAMVDFDPQRVVPDETKSLAEGAIAPWGRGDRKLVREALQALSRDFGIDLDAPFSRLPRKAREVLLLGAGKFSGLPPNLRRRAYEEGAGSSRMSSRPSGSLRACATCRGSG